MNDPAVKLMTALRRAMSLKAFSPCMSTNQIAPGGLSRALSPHYIEGLLGGMWGEFEGY